MGYVCDYYLIHLTRAIMNKFNSLSQKCHNSLEIVHDFTISSVSRFNEHTIKYVMYVKVFNTTDVICAKPHHIVPLYPHKQLKMVLLSLWTVTRTVRTVCWNRFRVCDWVCPEFLRTSCDNCLWLSTETFSIMYATH